MNERLLNEYEPLIKRLAKKYAYVTDYQDIYQQCVLYLLEAQQNDVNIENSIQSRIRTYIKHEKNFKELERIE